MREQDPQRLFERICEIAVLHGGQRMAWIGQHDTAQQYLRPLAVYVDGRISAMAKSPSYLPSAY